MATILAEAQIEDLAKFWSVFSTRGLEARKKHGSHAAQVFRNLDDPRKVVLLFEWESREALQRFLDDPEVKASMRASGTVAPPKFTFLEKAGELPG